MTSRQRKYLIGIDIGAGSGAKLGLFASETEQIGDALLPLDRYGTTAEALVASLAKAVEQLLNENRIRPDAILAVGIATPGLLQSDGSVRSAANLPFLRGANIAAMLTRSLGVPARTINDADAGALAEWSRRRTELLYWVLGGGWGGAWISADGRVRFPALDWDGNDASLHYTSEPGYAIPLAKADIDRAFASFGGSFAAFMEFALRKLHLSTLQTIGPSGREDCVRAELLVSGPGRWRIFRYITGQGPLPEDVLPPDQVARLLSPTDAGPVLDQLARIHVPAVTQTDAVFGTLLAEAAAVLFRQAIPQGCPNDIPIFMGGKPSRALPFFLPATRQRLKRHGITSPISLSCFDEEDKNANLFGAAFAAKSALQKGQ